mmetsp:Transcript_24367/g.58805  ORF Transcript_24367/g.58805 Transcript_24367/m.58805 type:complete len:538 (-) Transcript_24367:182-1795(-)
MEKDNGGAPSPLPRGGEGGYVTGCTDEKQDALIRAMHQNFFCPFYPSTGRQRHASDSSSSGRIIRDEIRAYLKHVKDNCLDKGKRDSLLAYENRRLSSMRTHKQQIEELCRIAEKQDVLKEEERKHVLSRIKRCQMGFLERILGELNRRADSTEQARSFLAAKSHLKRQKHSKQVKEKIITGEHKTTSKREKTQTPEFRKKMQDTVRQIDRDLMIEEAKLPNLEAGYRSTEEYRVSKCFEGIISKLGKPDVGSEDTESLRRLHKRAQEFLHQGSKLNKAGFAFEDYVLRSHKQGLCRAAGVAMQSNGIDRTFKLILLRNLEIEIPRFKNNIQKGFSKDGEVDAALVDIGQDPWQVVHLFEFKRRAADIVKADFQRSEIFRKLFMCNGALVCKGADAISVPVPNLVSKGSLGNDEKGFPRLIRLESDTNFRTWFKRNKKEDSMLRLTNRDVERASYDHFSVVTRPFNRRTMTGLPSSVEPILFKMCVTNDDQMLLIYKEKLEVQLLELCKNGSSSPKSVVEHIERYGSVRKSIIVAAE